MSVTTEQMVGFIKSNKDSLWFKQVIRKLGDEQAIDELTKAFMNCEHCSTMDEFIEEDDAIGCLFKWSDSPQGHGFWEDIES